MSESNTPVSPDTLQVQPAFLSLICPGLGQLSQDRFGVFFAHFAFFLLVAAAPVAFICVWISKEPQFYHGGMKMDWAFFVLSAIFPILLAFFSILDAAAWKPGQKSSRFNKYVRNLFFCAIAFYLLLLVLLPAFSSTKAAARRMHCTNNLKTIALALHSYHDQYGSFPPAYTVDENGQPLHSWRVLILPFLEEKNLYQEIRLDEPWNSEHNRQFHAQKIPIFECNTGGLLRLLSKEFSEFENKNRCFYSVVIGEETAFPGSKPVKLEDIHDGSYNTILVAERLIPVCWMDPNHEITYDAALDGVNRNLFGIGSAHLGGANVAACDGSIVFVSNSIEPEGMKTALTIAGGETVSIW